MEHTLEQALQKGIEFHKAGNLQEADRYYTAILKANPKHPDANHNLGVLAVTVDKVEAALPFFKIALEANPNTAQYWLSYIDALIKLDRVTDAKAVFDQAKSKGAKGEAFDQIEERLGSTTFKNSNLQEPSQEKLISLMRLYNENRLQQVFKETQKLTKRYIKNLTLWNLMGSSAAQLGYLGEAINAFQHAISIKPDFAEAHNNMGNALQAHGRLQEAIDAFKKAVSTKPNYAEAYYNMGNALLAHGSLDEAVDAFKKAISTKPGYAEAYNNLGNALKEQEKLDEAIDAFKKAISVKPDYVEAEMNLAAIKRLAVPDWHIPMMNEDFRNNAYQKAIKSAVQDRDVVLDIGTGAGLLSMIAADCGAKEVISCEVSSTISKIADKIIQKNGFADKITLINKNSKNIKLGQDISGKADILVSEILSSEFVGEGIQTSILDAKKRLLKKNGKMIPQSGSIMISLIENTGKLAKELFVDNALGYDISDFNAITCNKRLITLEDEPILLSDPIEVFTFDFCNFEAVYLDKKKVTLPVNRTASCAGIIQWIKVNLFEDIEYQNNPVMMYREATVSGWKTPIYRFDTPLDITKGTYLNIEATLTEDYCWFTLNSS